MKNRVFKVLAIDDIFDNLISLKALINETFPEAKIYTAQSGKLGLEIALAELPDIILLDILMPKMDGYEVCRRLKSIPGLNDIPVIFVTALKDDRENRIPALEAGAEGFISKPIDVAELTAQIRAMLKIRDANIKIRDEKIWLEMQVKNRTAELQNELNERKKAEEALTESEARIKSIFRASPVGIGLIKERIIFEVNDYLCRLAGYSREELIGKNARILYPSDEEYDFVGFEKYRQIANSGTGTVETQFITKSGQIKNILLSSTPVNRENISEGITFTALDITDRKKTEMALRNSEERFSLVIDATEEGIWDFNLETNEIYYSKQWKKQIGYNDNELKNEFDTWVEHLHPDDKERCVKAVEEYIINPWEHFILEFRLRHKDGSYRWIRCKAASIQNKEGKAIRMFGSHSDVTESKRAEKALQYASENWNKTFRSINSGILLLDNKQRIVQSNKSFQEFVGKKAADLYQNCCYEFVHGTDCQYEDCPFARMKITKQREMMEINLKGREYEIIVDPIFNEDNEINGAVHILNDISQRKKDEKIQQVLFEIARYSLASKKLEKLLIKVRSELHKVIDTTNFFVALYDQKSDILKKVLFADEKDDFEEWIATGSLSGYIVKKGTSLLFKKSKESRFLASNGIKSVGTPAECWLGVPLKINKKALGVMVVQSYTNPDAYDSSSVRLMEMIANELAIVIERNMMIDDLVNALDKAEESDRLKSAFLANISHEIRTPMNGILGFTGLLDDPGLQENDKKYYISIIQKSSERLLNTVNDLIEISKIETGQTQIILDETSICEQVSALYKDFKPLALEKKLEFLLKSEIANTVITVKTDVSKFNTILKNLVKNAIKYTDNGTVEIGCYIENENLFFYVKDTGIGIPVNRQQAIFNRFEQADILDKRAYQGSGLGLSIAKAYVEMLGGEINLKSTPGQGSVFSFNLPLNTDGIMQNPDLAPLTTKKKEITRMRGLKIAIAEDDESSLLYLQAILKEVDAEFICCYNGAEIVEKCRENPDIDIVLMDLRMPVLDGYEAIKQIREFNKDVVIIAQTAFALTGDKEKAKAAGCNDYISKPIKRNELIGMINKYNEF